MKGNQEVVTIHINSKFSDGRFAAFLSSGSYLGDGAIDEIIAIFEHDLGMDDKRIVLSKSDIFMAYVEERFGESQIKSSNHVLQTILAKTLYLILDYHPNRLD